MLLSISNLMIYSICIFADWVTFTRNLYLPIFKKVERERERGREGARERDRERQRENDLAFHSGDIPGKIFVQFY